MIWEEFYDDFKNKSYAEMTEEIIDKISDQDQDNTINNDK